MGCFSGHLYHVESDQLLHLSAFKFTICSSNVHFAGKKKDTLHHNDENHVQLKDRGSLFFHQSPWNWPEKCVKWVSVLPFQGMKSKAHNQDSNKHYVLCSLEENANKTMLSWNKTLPFLPIAALLAVNFDLRCSPVSPHCAPVRNLITLQMKPRSLPSIMGRVDGPGSPPIYRIHVYLQINQWFSSVSANSGREGPNSTTVRASEARKGERVC